MRGVKVPFPFNPSVYKYVDVQAKGAYRSSGCCTGHLPSGRQPVSQLFHSLVRRGLKAGFHCCASSIKNLSQLLSALCNE